MVKIDGWEDWEVDIILISAYNPGLLSEEGTEKAKKIKEKIGSCWPELLFVVPKERIDRIFNNLLLQPPIPAINLREKVIWWLS